LTQETTEILKCKIIPVPAHEGAEVKYCTLLMLALDLSECPVSYSESRIVLSLFNDLTVTVFNAGEYKHLLNNENTWHAKLLLFLLIFNFK
jgi:hypothetical protein